jgi:hypothetical protein
MQSHAAISSNLVAIIQAFVLFVIAAVHERAEEEGREDDAPRRVLPEQCHGDGVEPVARGEPVVDAAEDAAHLDHPAEAREPASDAHDEHHVPRRIDARLGGRARPEADRPKAIAERGAPEEEPEEHDREGGEHDPEMQAAERDELVRDDHRQPRAQADRRRGGRAERVLRGHRPVLEQPMHHEDDGVVEHDRRDDLVHTARRLQQPDDAAVRGATGDAEEHDDREEHDRR